MTNTEIDATRYSAGELVEIANIVAAPYDGELYQTAEDKARAIIPAVLALVRDIGPRHDCGRELYITARCPVCDNDE